MDAFLLDHLLRAAATQRPDELAVEADGAALTYAALDTAADRIASALGRLGVGLGDRVALHLEKGPEAVAAIYGIMRAGAAYVPIDVSAPAARSAYIATDCGVAALVSTPAGIDALRAADPAAAPRGIVCGEAAPPDFIAWSELENEPRAPARDRIDTDLAYILYTSGSTGRPKGVAISHRSSLTFIRWAHETLALTAEDRFSSHAPFHFDLSTLDIFGAASAAATVSLVPRTASLFPARLVEWIRARQITVWYSVPSALTLLLRHGALGAESLDGVRLMLFAGETFPVPRLRELMSLAPRARFFNLYGPTETNVCTYHEVARAPAEDDPPVPIGTACANTRCEVVDESGVPLTTIGSQGELVVHGSTVARGYWGDPERTAASFPAPGSYRTGDIVEIIAESPPSYRLLGRRDHLVKSRGYRIELGEIEAALYADPAVEECVAVAVPDELVGNRLAAFCTVRDGGAEDELKRGLRGRLPGYMVPDLIAVVDALPRTPNDKYDRITLAKQAEGLVDTDGN